MQLFTDSIEINTNAANGSELFPNIGKERSDEIAHEVGEIEKKFTARFTGSGKMVNIFNLFKEVMDASLAKNDEEQLFIIITLGLFMGAKMVENDIAMERAQALHKLFLEANKKKVD